MKITTGYDGAERILPTGAVEELVSLNRDYIDLLSANADDTLVSFAPGLLPALRLALPPVRDAMAACSYALFVLDPPHGLPADCPQPTHVNDPVAERYGTGTLEGGAWPAFTLAALSFAWQLSRHNPMSARVMLGFSEASACSMAAMDLWKLRRVAVRQTRPLEPRWSRNPCFWPDLLRSAGDLDPLRLDLAKLLGVQLLAADLHPRRGIPERPRAGQGVPGS